MRLHQLMQLLVLSGVGLAALSDVRTGRIPNRLTGALAFVVFALALASGDLAAAMRGALTAGGSLGLLFVASRGRAIGLDDVKLAVGIGAALGAVGGSFALACAFAGGAVYAAALIAAGRARRSDTIPFAPFLAGGTLVAMLFGSST